MTPFRQVFLQYESPSPLLTEVLIFAEEPLSKAILRYLLNGSFLLRIQAAIAGVRRTEQSAFIHGGACASRHVRFFIVPVLLNK